MVGRMILYPGNLTSHDLVCFGSLRTRPGSDWPGMMNSCELAGVKQRGSQLYLNIEQLLQPPHCYCVYLYYPLKNDSVTPLL